jgi:1-acyl-sn-glycerol-3-phosphate acyltransferase
MSKEELKLKSLSLLTLFGPGKRFMQRIDDAVMHEGLPGGFSTFLSERNVLPDPVWDDEERTKTVLQNPEKPVILISNHQNRIEPYVVIAALPPRENVSYIAESGNTRIFGQEASKHFITVWHPGIRETAQKKIERQERNNRSLEVARQRLEAGNVVYIAPDGADGTGDWKRGSVQLIEKARELDEAYLVMTHVDVAKGDYVHLITKKGKDVPVRFSQPIKVHDLLLPDYSEGNLKQNRIAAGQSLKQFYDAWRKS